MDETTPPTRPRWGEAPTGDIAESILDPGQVSQRLGPTPIPDSSTFGQRHPSSENLALRDQPATAAERESGAAATLDALAMHHVGIAVRSIDEALRFYQATLGLPLVDRRVLADRQLDVAFVQAGATLIELLEPTSEASTVARFLERRGPGLHHLCFGTASIDEHLRTLQDQGIELIDQVARPGAHGEVAFLHPAAAHGVLVELLQPSNVFQQGPAAGTDSGPERAGGAEPTDVPPAAPVSDSVTGPSETSIPPGPELQPRP